MTRIILTERQSETDGAHNRGATRESIFLGAVVHFEGHHTGLKTRVRNISGGGMMIDCTEIWPVRHVVKAEIKGIGIVTGEVAWSTENRMGIRFDVTIDPKKARMQVGGGFTPQPQTQPRPFLSGGRRPGLGIR